VSYSFELPCLESNTDYDPDGSIDTGEELSRVDARFTTRSTGAVIDATLVGRLVATPAGAWGAGWTGTARCSERYGTSLEVRKAALRRLPPMRHPQLCSVSAVR
jgi:hypothetical protein